MKQPSARQALAAKIAAAAKEYVAAARLDPREPEVEIGALIDSLSAMTPSLTAADRKAIKRAVAKALAN